MYVKYINTNMYAKYGDNADFLVQLEGFVSKFLESNAKIEGFASIERMVKISVH